MKIKIPKMVEKLDLREYAPELEEAIDVWVNPPRAMILERDGLHALASGLLERQKVAQGEELEKLLNELNEVGARLMGWYAEIFSAGADAERHWSLEEVTALVEHSRETDPRLWMWITGKTKEMIYAHRGQLKKG